MEIHNKLVRDKIPEIIEKNGEIAVTRVIENDEEFKIELFDKLFEECREVIKTDNSDDLMEELADVFEVINALAETQNKGINDVIKIAQQKRNQRGSFRKRLYLERTYKRL